MQKNEITLSKLGFASDVDNTETLRRIVKHLLMHLRAKWVDVAHSINEPASGRPGREPRFSDLTKFVDEKSRIASSMFVCLFVSLLYVPSQQLWSLRDGQFT